MSTPCSNLYALRKPTPKCAAMVKKGPHKKRTRCKNKAAKRSRYCRAHQPRKVVAKKHYAKPKKNKKYTKKIQVCRAMGCAKPAKHGNYCQLHYR